jgi:hypothetical protein
LQSTLQNYEDLLSKVKTRFNLPDFLENQRVAEPDPKDTDDTIPVTPRNSGRETINGTTAYLVLSIRGYNKTITFDTAAPTVRPYQQMNLFNGTNNGTYTVSRIISSTTIEVFEDLLDESPSPTKVILV